MTKPSFSGRKGKLKKPKSRNGKVRIGTDKALIRPLIDYDYIDKLSPDEALFLKTFTDAYYSNNKKACLELKFSPNEIKQSNDFKNRVYRDISAFFYKDVNNNSPLKWTDMPISETILNSMHNPEPEEPAKLPLCNVCHKEIDGYKIIHNKSKKYVTIQYFCHGTVMNHYFGYKGMDRQEVINQVFKYIIFE